MTENELPQGWPFSKVSVNFSESALSAFSHSRALFRAMSEPADLEKVSLVHSTSTTTEAETPLLMRHFWPAPTGRVMRRRKTKKWVHTTNGNPALHLPVPSKLVLPCKGDAGMLKTRYTVVICDHKVGYNSNRTLSFGSDSGPDLQYAHCRLLP